MKYFLILCLLFTTNVLAQSPQPKTVGATADDQDVEVCTYPSGVKTCPIQIDGTTGDIPRESIALDNGFTSGTLEVNKIGSRVTVTMKSPGWTASPSTIVSSVGLLPSQYRPTHTIVTWGDIVSSRIPIFKVDADGRVVVIIRSASDPSTASGDASSTFSSVTWSVTYLVDQ